MALKRDAGEVTVTQGERMKASKIDWWRPLFAVLGATIAVALLIAEVLAGGALAEHAAPWAAQLQKLDEALAKKNVSAALIAWHEAYTLALGSRRWEGMVEVGDGYLRIGDALNARKPYVPRARESYLTALFRARQQGSLDGVLRAAEGFAALGDHEVVEQCIRIAERLATESGDGKALDRVHAFAERWADRSLAAGQLRVGP